MIVKKPSKTSFIAYSLFFLSFCMVIGACYSVATIDVVKDWKLILPDQPIHAGDTIIVKSEYTKLRNVTGIATRYIDCDTTGGSRLSYILNQKEANRGAGKSTGTAVEITLPTNIPNLPTRCDFRIIVKYRVVPFKDTTEFNQTKDFTLLPEPNGGSSVSLPLATQTTQPQTSGVSQPLSAGNAQSSSVNNTASGNSSQSNSSQTTNGDLQPGIAMQILQGAQNLVNNILKVVL